MNDTVRPTTTRRQFLAQTGAVIGSASLLSATGHACAEKVEPLAERLPVPAWVHGVTRMSFLSPSQVEQAAAAGVQVVHTNVLWPFYPLRRDGGGPKPKEHEDLKSLVNACHDRGMKLVLGLPPFPPASLMNEHPQWRIASGDPAEAVKIKATDDDLGTRLACNESPWGDYLIDLCAELVADYDLDGFSFDGNYHPALCRCPSCVAMYRRDAGVDVPGLVNLDDVAYRRYLVWRGERLESHYLRLQQRIKQAKPDAVIMTWTVNAGRYGHFLHSPRAMPTRLNRVFDLAMQEWWLDETNIGASIMPVFGATYLRATMGDRPAAAEPYLMSRGNPYGTDSFPAHERLTRCLLAVTCGNVLALSMGWPGHDVAGDFGAVRAIEPYLTRTTPLKWAGMLVSEQTRQFHAWRDIPGRFLPHALGAFRAAGESHLPLWLLNDWDVAVEELSQYAVIVLPSAAAMSDEQVEAIRQYVHAGGGLVVTGESSLCDEIGRRRPDFALADLLGVSHRGTVASPDDAALRPQLDENFARSLDETYWRDRVGVATLAWGEHELFDDAALKTLVPHRSVRFRGPLVRVADPADPAEVVMRFTPEGKPGEALPGLILRSVGKGRVAYFAAGVDAATWSYAYPYQRHLFVRAVRWAAARPQPIDVRAPMCVHAAHFTQVLDGRKRIVTHLFNNVNTMAHHGLPAAEVPLREETVPIHNIEVVYHGKSPAAVTLEPGHQPLQLRRDGDRSVATLPPLLVHHVLVADA